MKAKFKDAFSKFVKNLTNSANSEYDSKNLLVKKRDSFFSEDEQQKKRSEYFIQEDEEEKTVKMSTPEKVEASSTKNPENDVMTSGDSLEKRMEEKEELKKRGKSKLKLLKRKRRINSFFSEDSVSILQKQATLIMDDLEFEEELETPGTPGDSVEFKVNLKVDPKTIRQKKIILSTPPKSKKVTIDQKEEEDITTPKKKSPNGIVGDEDFLSPKKNVQKVLEKSGIRRKGLLETMVEFYNDEKSHIKSMCSLTSYFDVLESNGLFPQELVLIRTKMEKAKKKSDIFTKDVKRIIDVTQGGEKNQKLSSSDLQGLIVQLVVSYFSQFFEFFEFIEKIECTIKVVTRRANEDEKFLKCLLDHQRDIYKENQVMNKKLGLESPSSMLSLVLENVEYFLLYQFMLQGLSDHLKHLSIIKKEISSPSASPPDTQKKPSRFSLVRSESSINMNTQIHYNTISKILIKFGLMLRKLMFSSPGFHERVKIVDMNESLQGTVFLDPFVERVELNYSVYVLKPSQENGEEEKKIKCRFICFRRKGLILVYQEKDSTKHFLFDKEKREFSMNFVDEKKSLTLKNSNWGAKELTLHWDDEKIYLKCKNCANIKK